MVKPLSFKGDPKSKKRKHRPTSPPPSALTNTTSDAASLDEDQTWTSPSNPSDLTGPTTLLVSGSFLSADPAGKIFLSPTEDDEPTDVRQVWLTTRPKDSNVFALRSSSGGYLSCTSSGDLHALPTARGEREGWEILPHPSSSSFILRSGAGGFLSLSPDSKSKSILRIVDEESQATEVTVKMQSRFLPTVKAAKVEKAYEKISRSQMEKDAGRKLDDEEAKRLKRARKEGGYNEAMLDVRQRGRHDKFA